MMNPFVMPPQGPMNMNHYHMMQAYQQQYWQHMQQQQQQNGGQFPMHPMGFNPMTGFMPPMVGMNGAPAFGNMQAAPAEESVKRQQSPRPQQPAVQKQSAPQKASGEKENRSVGGKSEINNHQHSISSAKDDKPTATPPRVSSSPATTGKTFSQTLSESIAKTSAKPQQQQQQNNQVNQTYENDGFGCK